MLCCKCNVEMVEPGKRGTAVFVNMCGRCVENTFDGNMQQPFAHGVTVAPRDVYPVVVEAKDPHLPEGKLDPVRSGFSERGRVLKASWRTKESE